MAHRAAFFPSDTRGARRRRFVLAPHPIERRRCLWELRISRDVSWVRVGHRYSSPSAQGLTAPRYRDRGTPAGPPARWNVSEGWIRVRAGLVPERKERALPRPGTRRDLREGGAVRAAVFRPSIPRSRGHRDLLVFFGGGPAVGARGLGDECRPPGGQGRPGAGYLPTPLRLLAGVPLAARTPQPEDIRESRGAG